MPSTGLIVGQLQIMAAIGAVGVQIAPIPPSITDVSAAIGSIALKPALVLTTLGPVLIEALTILVNDLIILVQRGTIVGQRAGIATACVVAQGIEILAALLLGLVEACTVLTDGLVVLAQIGAILTNGLSILADILTIASQIAAILTNVAVVLTYIAAERLSLGKSRGNGTQGAEKYDHCCAAEHSSLPSVRVRERSIIRRMPAPLLTVAFRLINLIARY